MKKLVFISIVLSFMALPAMADLFVTNGGATPADGLITSAVSGAIVDTFEGTSRPAWTYGGNYRILTGGISGQAGIPWYGEPDPTAYLAVPEVDNGSGVETATVLFGGQQSKYLGLFWGSMDKYNEVRLYDGSKLVGTVTGEQASLPGIALGNQGDYMNNGYVNIASTIAFDRIEFASYGGYGGVSPFAFEVDNLAIVPVPVPGAALLGFIGMATSAHILRRRRNKA